MDTILDYVRWRGDLSFSQSALNEVDGVVFARLAYLPYETIPQERSGADFSVAKVAAAFLSQKDSTLSEQDRSLLMLLRECERYRALKLFAYEVCTDEETQTQFAAISVELPQDGAFLAFRGTDNTLVGWKEDFNMSFVFPVPAQRLALEYLEQVSRRVQGRLRLGGHSKGGNLAVYAAAFCPASLQCRIVDVYNYDGPGFTEQTLQNAGFSAILARVHTFVPQSSIVGMTLSHEEAYSIVHSLQKGIWQHDMYSWEVRRTDFVKLQTVDNSSRFIDGTLKAWLSKLDEQQRAVFIDTIYDIMRQTNATTLRELTDNWLESAVAVTRAMANLDEPTRKTVLYALGLLLKSTREGFIQLLPVRNA